MNRSFRERLRRLLLVGTIVPTTIFITIFIIRYYMINLNSQNDLFDAEVAIFDAEIEGVFDQYIKIIEISSYFLNNHDLTSEERDDYLNDLLDLEAVEEYYYISLQGTVSNLTMASTGNLNAQIFRNYSSDYDQWIRQLETTKDQYLYFGYSINQDNILVIGVNYHEIFKSISDHQEGKRIYQIIYDGEPIYGAKHAFAYFHDESTSIVDYEGQKYRWIENPLVYDGLSYGIAINISQEMSMIKEKLVLPALLIFIYLTLLTVTLANLSKILLKPINELIDYISSMAEGRNLRTVPNKENELAEIYERFDDMVNTSYQNIQSIQDQTEIIMEKNKIMEDLNHQLALSSEMIEESTKELKIYEKQSKTLVDNIKDLMWVIDTKGRIQYINAIVEDKLGYSADELIGVKLESILKEDEYNEEAIHDMFYEDYDDMDFVFLKKYDESEEIFATSTKRIFSNGKLMKIQGVSRDITEERFIESQMIQKNVISNTLNEISEILTKPEKLEVLLNHIVVRIERLLNPLICTIRLIDDRNRLELMAGIGEFYSLVQERYLDIEKDISGRAIKESKIIIVTEKVEEYYDNYDEVHTIIDQSRELIFLPLEYNEGVIGVMSIGLRENITDAQLKILKVFTTQASAAIEKARMYEELENNYLNIIKALASTVEAKDAYTEDHSIRVAEYSRMIAEELGMNEEEVAYIDIAGLLHDIGKIGVSDLTLTKEGRLSEDEFMEIKKHPLNGGRIVSEMKLHEHIVEGVLLHHKRFDLKGYPDIHVETLPISARIIGVADAFDAMTRDRSYQKARTFEEAYDELKRYSGTQFCPEIVGVMERVISRLS